MGGGGGIELCASAVIVCPSSSGLVIPPKYFAELSVRFVCSEVERSGAPVSN